MKDDALLGFLVALVVAAILTPLVARLARRIGAVDAVKERGLAREATPLLGGLAIFAGVLVAALLFLPMSEPIKGILAGAALITAVGALDDWRELGAGDEARRPGGGRAGARALGRDRRRRSRCRSSAASSSARPATCSRCSGSSAS